MHGLSDAHTSHRLVGRGACPHFSDEDTEGKWLSCTSRAVTQEFPSFLTCALLKTLLYPLKWGRNLHLSLPLRCFSPTQKYDNHCCRPAGIRLFLISYPYQEKMYSFLNHRHELLFLYVLSKTLYHMLGVQPWAHGPSNLSVPQFPHP